LAKTVQALKLSTTIALQGDALGGIVDYIVPESVRAVKAATAKVRFTFAIASRFDDPQHQQRVSLRLADIKEELGKLGTIEAWHVTAGAVPADEAEVLPEIAPAVAKAS